MTRSGTRLRRWFVASATNGYILQIENVRLRYSRLEAADEKRRNIDVKSPGPFEFEGREWNATSFEGDDGLTLCVEHERIFHVSLEGATDRYTGPRPEEGEVVSLDGGGPRVRVSNVSPAHHDARHGSFSAQRIDL
jgi:hypothetical protein